MIKMRTACPFGPIPPTSSIARRLRRLPYKDFRNSSECAPKISSIIFARTFLRRSKVKRLIALASTLFITTLFGIAITTVAADDQSADANAALANALKQADLPLEQGLAMSSREG